MYFEAKKRRFYKNKNLQILEAGDRGRGTGDAGLGIRGGGQQKWERREGLGDHGNGIGDNG